MNINFKTIKAFTVLETLFAIVIFSLALVSLMAVSGQGVVAVNSVREEMIAGYLNQEAIESIRWYRDNQKLTTAPTSFAALFPTSCSATIPCSVNITPPADPVFTACGAMATSTCPSLYENSGVYTTTTTGSVTSFRRGVTILVDTTNNTARVTSRVVWSSKDIIRTNELQVTLADW